MKFGLDSLTKKAIFIFIFALLLQIPLVFINGIVSERDSLREKAVESVSEEWAQEQKIAGPFIVLECVKSEEKNMDMRKFIILPEKLKVSSVLDTSVRKRGMYNTTVYTGDFILTGNITLPDKELLRDYKIKESYVSLGIGDNRGIVKVKEFEIDGMNMKVDAGTDSNLINKGISAFMKNFNYTTGREIPFKISLELRGTQNVSFLPFGIENDFEVESSWVKPGFFGMLPAEHKVDKNGFKAMWNIPNLVRNYRQYFWEDEITSDKVYQVNKYEYSASIFDQGIAGVKLHEGITQYNQIRRAAKYGILFIILTLLVVYIFEISGRKNTHYIQYGIVGFSLALFYLILLSLVEYMSFNTAYVIAALAVAIPNSLYIKGITYKMKYGVGMFVFLCGIYAVLYSILKMQNYSLLIGTLLITGVVYVLMYMTKNMDRFQE